jgi:hypothetical protein
MVLRNSKTSSNILVSGRDFTHLTIEFKIPASFANFGNIPYGQSMVSFPRMLTRCLSV